VNDEPNVGSDVLQPFPAGLKGQQTMTQPGVELETCTVSVLVALVPLPVIVPATGVDVPPVPEMKSQGVGPSSKAPLAALTLMVSVPSGTHAEIRPFPLPVAKVPALMLTEHQLKKS